MHIAADTDFNLHPEIDRVFLNSTSPEDYPAIEASTRKSSAVVPFFGYHPWMARDISFSDKALIHSLNALPASGIGECGLDSLPEYKPLMDTQLKLFMIQLELSVKLERPLSIHCVHAWQHLFTCLDIIGPLPKPFILHSFYGSKETLSRLLAYGAFISISALSIRNPTKSYPVIAAVPIDRILVESDMISGSPGFSVETHLQELKNTYNVASSIFRIPESDFISKVWENGTVFTN
jgi:TatD DNase family protein